jgi:hypothetical protein
MWLKTFFGARVVVRIVESWSVLEGGCYIILLYNRFRLSKPSFEGNPG